MVWLRFVNVTIINLLTILNWAGAIMVRIVVIVKVCHPNITWFNIIWYFSWVCRDLNRLDIIMFRINSWNLSFQILLNSNWILLPYQHSRSLFLILILIHCKMVNLIGLNRQIVSSHQIKLKIWMLMSNIFLDYLIFLTIYRLIHLVHHIWLRRHNKLGQTTLINY